MGSQGPTAHGKPDPWLRAPATTEPLLGAGYARDAAPSLQATKTRRCHLAKLFVVCVPVCQVDRLLYIASRIVGATCVWRAWGHQASNSEWGHSMAARFGKLAC